jgi:fatty acid desaturase
MIVDKRHVARAYLLLLGAGLLLEGAALLLAAAINLPVPYALDNPHNALHVVWGLLMLGVLATSRDSSRLVSLTMAPNHTGMTTWPTGARARFVERQVLSSRFVLGGLTYQVEHHLFPHMSRAHLNRTRILVRQFCAEQGLAYDERGVVASYRIVVRELRTIGRQPRLGSAA